MPRLVQYDKNWAVFGIIRFFLYYTEKVFICFTFIIFLGF